MIRIFTFISVFLFLLGAHAQTRESLKENKQLYFYGNSILIGNNILGHHATKPMMQDDVSKDASVAYAALY